MRIFLDLPVRHKITAIALLTILVVSLLSSTIFVLLERRAARNDLVQELAAIAGIVADNSTAALVFDDPVSAEETLSALRAIPSIARAEIHRAEGGLFARYPTGGAAEPGDGQIGGEGYGPVFRDDNLRLARPIVLNGETVGTISIQSDLNQIETAVARQIATAFLATLVSLAVAYLLISRLQSVVSRPIEHLLETMNEISAKRDYGLRARAQGTDELGSLVRGFNRMLDQIQDHQETLRETQRQAEAANRAKSEFLASMSHELRTPLNAILGFSEILMMEMAGPLGAPRYKEYAFDIHESGRHLLEVIGDILDISKIEAGRIDLVETEIHPERLVEKARRLIVGRAGEAEVGLRLKVRPDLPLLLADERLVKQAVLNLLSNAVKFTPPGGEVCLSLDRDPDGALVIVVQDNGIGIDEADLERVLTPFGQVETSLSRKHHGTGLGLPLAKSFVELHGGELRLRSALGQGTRVSLRFPPERSQTRGPSQQDPTKTLLSA